MAFNGITHNGAINKFLATQSNPQQTRAELERFYEETKPVHGVRMDSRYLIIDRLSFQVMRAEDVVWVHHQQTQMKLYGVVPTGNIHHVIIRTGDGKDHCVAVSTKHAAKDLIARLFPLLPNAVFGYSPQLVKAWNEGKNSGCGVLRLMGQLQHSQA